MPLKHDGYCEPLAHIIAEQFVVLTFADATHIQVPYLQTETPEQTGARRGHEVAAADATGANTKRLRAMDRRRVVMRAFYTRWQYDTGQHMVLDEKIPFLPFIYGQIRQRTSRAIWIRTVPAAGNHTLCIFPHALCRCRSESGFCGFACYPLVARGNNTCHRDS
ncbi:MAG: hypothetical protein JWM56_505 [Candidatus Peribacteria bacterium]|nr:hypothetical protein [Candidatus Peribacteria bacterium]